MQSTSTELTRYNPKHKTHNSKRALLVLDRSFFNRINNANVETIDNFLSIHRCILWTVRGTHNDDRVIADLPFITGRIIGLINNAKNMTYIRNLFRSQKDLLSLPSILIDCNLEDYVSTGYDMTIDLKDYITIGLQKYVNMFKVIEDVNKFLDMWYDYNYEFDSSISSGIVVKQNKSIMDYRF